MLRGRLARRTAANHDAWDATLEVLDFQPKLVSPVAAQEGALLLSTDGDATALVQSCEAPAAELLESSGVVGELPLLRIGTLDLRPLEPT